MATFGYSHPPGAATPGMKVLGGIQGLATVVGKAFTL